MKQEGCRRRRNNKIAHVLLARHGTEPSPLSERRENSLQTQTKRTNKSKKSNLEKEEK